MDLVNNISEGYSWNDDNILCADFHLNSSCLFGGTYSPVLHCFNAWRIYVAMRKINVGLILSKKESYCTPRLHGVLKYIRKMRFGISNPVKYPRGGCRLSASDCNIRFIRYRYTSHCSWGHKNLSSSSK